MAEGCKFPLLKFVLHGNFCEPSVEAILPLRVMYSSARGTRQSLMMHDQPKAYDLSPNAISELLPGILARGSLTLPDKMSVARALVVAGKRKSLEYTIEQEVSVSCDSAVLF